MSSIMNSIELHIIKSIQSVQEIISLFASSYLTRENIESFGHIAVTLGIAITLFQIRFQAKALKAQLEAQTTENIRSNQHQLDMLKLQYRLQRRDQLRDFYLQKESDLTRIMESIVFTKFYSEGEYGGFVATHIHKAKLEAAQSELAAKLAECQMAATSLRGWVNDDVKSLMARIVESECEFTESLKLKILDNIGQFPKDAKYLDEMILFFSKNILKPRDVMLTLMCLPLEN